ncbi:MAG TPA: DinB family protein [Candidatus Dormibacteraeota bacterium]|nr:DinB family protein [Candidatus Dormibacteraeota bacterium]
MAVIRPAFSNWPDYNLAFRDVVLALTEDQLALRPSPERWPMWATVGHAACQRVFWLCDFAGEPGANTTPFPDASHNCPGDDDLDTVLNGDQLATALESTFSIIERCLDTWTVASLDEVLRRHEWDETWVHTRGSVIQRVFAHDVYHIAEVNETLSREGLPLINLWG